MASGFLAGVCRFPEADAWIWLVSLFSLWSRYPIQFFPAIEVLEKYYGQANPNPPPPPAAASLPCRHRLWR